MAVFAGTGPIEPHGLYGPCRRIYYVSSFTKRIGYYYVYWDGERFCKGGADSKLFTEVNG